MNANHSKKQVYVYLFLLAMLAVLLHLRFFEHQMAGFNTTLFVLNYDLGFISRGLTGTVWKALGAFTGKNVFTYEAVYAGSLVMTVVYDLMLLGGFAYCFAKSDPKQHRNLFYLMLFSGIFLFTSFISPENFGRIDLYLYMLCFVMILLTVEEKVLFLIPLLCAAAMCIHQGFVFTHANLILVLLFYKIFYGTKKKQAAVIFALTFAVISVLFLYFEFASHPADPAVYDSLVTAAKGVSPDGDAINGSLLNHEILGMGVFMDEWWAHVENYKETPFFLILALPYLAVFASFARGLWKASAERPLSQRLPYLAFLCGPLTLVPEAILKVDYGRYANAVFNYFGMLMIVFLVMKDRLVEEELESVKAKIARVLPVPQLIVFYALFFVPMLDVGISDLVFAFSRLVFR